MRLVVTADDLGLGRGVTRGILEAHRDGVVCSTSALVTFAASEEGIARAREEPGLEIGLHIDLVGGRPVSDPATVSSLVDADGRFHALPVFTRRLLTGRIRSSDVAREVRAQVERARAWGAPALAWDSHRHVHLMPPIARVVGMLARELDARWVRRGRAPGFRSLAAKAMGLHASTVVADLFYRGLPGNRWYVDLTSHRPRLDAPAVALLAALGGVGEIAGHPGYVDDELATADGLLREREHDLALLTSPLLRRALGSDAVSWRVV